MLHRFFRRLWLHRKKSFAALLLAGFMLVNLEAYVQARAMTHFVAGARRTGSPESLSGFEKLGVLLTGVRTPRPVNFATPSAAGLPYQTHRFTTADGISLEAWYIPTVERSRGTCICFHAFTGCKSTLLRQAAVFGKLGWDVLLVDFRGSGGSSGSETTIGFLEAEDVAAAVAYVRGQFSPRSLILFGQSMGGAAILRAIAVKDITPDAIVLECPFDRLLSTARNRFDLMGLPRIGLDRLLVFWGSVDQGYWAFDHNPVDYARKVRCPTLLMHGALDPRVTRPQAESILAALGGEKQFVVFEGIAHEDYLDHCPRQWMNAVAAFLEYFTPLPAAPPATAATNR